jgi:hypothetical protein
MDNNEDSLYTIALEQNKKYQDVINPKFYSALKHIIIKYDWENPCLPKDDETLCDYKKLIEFNKLYTEKRENFLKMISKYLK